jgi:cyclopropane-fatty-acyl-phospholipid synthase
VRSVTGSTQAKEATLRLLIRFLPRERRFAVRLWDGTTLPASAGEPLATLVLAHEDSLGQMLRSPLDVAAGEAYIRGDFEVEGDMEAVFEAVEDVDPRFSPLDWARLLKDAEALRRHSRRTPTAVEARVRGRKHSKGRDRQAVQHHYDLSNPFYKLWLDERMGYSCGYFAGGDETLDQAQEAKLEHICRKLRLGPQEQLLDIGCGWGGLAIYAAERHGAEVTGVTLAQNQVEEARARAQAAGLLNNGVRIELRDYRDVLGTFDKIVSVGMAEHVGLENLPTYFKTAWDHLKPGGLMLNHAISRGPRQLKGPSEVGSGEFIHRYVFPDGEIVPLWLSLRAAEEVGFEVRDVEDLREHYAKTLRCWRRNLEDAWDAAVAKVGLERARLWRLFLAGSTHQFEYGHLSVHQALLGKPNERGQVPLASTRADIYA